MQGPKGKWPPCWGGCVVEVYPDDPLIIIFFRFLTLPSHSPSLPHTFSPVFISTHFSSIPYSLSSLSFLHCSLPSLPHHPSRPYSFYLLSIHLSLSPFFILISHFPFSLIAQASLIPSLPHPPSIPDFPPIFVLGPVLTPYLPYPSSIPLPFPSFYKYPFPAFPPTSIIPLSHPLPTLKNIRTRESTIGQATYTGQPLYI